MSFNYNKQRHLKLLKLKSAQESELEEYMYLLDGTLDWETKEQYIELLEKLSSGKISPITFYLKFKDRNHLNGEVYHILKANYLLLSPHEKSKEFSDLIREIMDFCYLYEDVFAPCDPGESTESCKFEFRKSVEEVYLKIQNLLAEK